MNDLANLLRVLADESRLELLTTLIDGDATVSELAARTGLPQPRVSSHLAILRAAGLVDSQRSGRQRAYHVDAERITPVLAALEVLLPARVETIPSPPRRSRQATALVTHDAPIRRARTCYDHLAGVAGVQLLDQLIARGWLRADGDDGKRTHYALTASGERELAARGVDLAGARASRRMHAYGCLDWTERRHHLGGALGAAILQSLIDRGVVTRRTDGRDVDVQATLESWLDASPVS
ncbi:MAG TPA: metalloregulator ArsR/SmtB family transcription factor [Thermomicrobiales bacterium]|nr:metalloregulator ArsR/SmtB family transcription factor [Thermomicrobiales bacterium]